MTNPDDIRQWRAQMRGDLLSRRVAVTADQHQNWNKTITRLLVEGFPVLQWMWVSFYWPYKGEFDPRFTIRRLRKYGARAALPTVVQKNAPLQFREWWPGARMTSGVFNLPVPDGTEVVRPEAMLIPPVGFDALGYRLGYGGGYFDRTLAVISPQPLKIGVAFELSRIPTIYPQPHDVPMDFIVTESGVHYVSKRGLEHVSDARRVLQLAGEIIRGRERSARGKFIRPGGIAAGATSPVTRQYASPPCYAHELDPAFRET